MKDTGIIKKCISEISSASDRACAIVSVTLFDAMLTEVLKNCLGSTKEPNDPIDSITFDAKVNLAYRIGLLDSDEYNILCKINEIRNIFAHNPHASDFRYDEIVKKMQKLKETQILYSIINNPTRHYYSPGGWDNYRIVFEFAVYYMLSFLVNIRVEPLKIEIEPKFTTILDYVYENIE